MDKHRLTVPARSSCAAGDDACERRFRSKVRGSLTLYGSFAASQSRILRRLPERKGPVLTYVQHPSCMYLILSDCRVGALRRGATSSPFSFFHRDILLGATPLTRSPSAIWFFFSHAVCGKARDKKGTGFHRSLEACGLPTGRRNVGTSPTLACRAKLPAPGDSQRFGGLPRRTGFRTA